MMPDFLAQDAKTSFVNSAKYQLIVLDSHHSPYISIIDHPHCTKRLKSLFIIYTFAQNFFLLKIHLNLFEISNRVLKFENLIEMIIPSQNLFQT
jgi:hypothetical protein